MRINLGLTACDEIVRGSLDKHLGNLILYIDNALVLKTKVMSSCGY